MSGQRPARHRRRWLPPISLRTRLLAAFIALAVIPCLTLTLVISQRLSRSIEFWGNPGVERTVDSSMGAARVALRALKEHLLEAVEGMAEGQAAPGGLDILRVYEREDGRYALRQAEASATGLLLTSEEIAAALDASRLIEKPEGFLIAIAAADSAALRVIVGGYAIPPEFFAQIAEARRGASLFDRLKLYLAVSKGWVWISTGFVALMVLVTAIVLARFMARGLTRPIEDLVLAMERLGRGEQTPALAPSGDQEMAYLVNSFNRMAAELERSRRDLRRAERLAAWQDVARRVAHEIKNPLTPIQFAIHRLKQELGSTPVPDADVGREGQTRLHESLDAILGEVESLRHMADEFSRLAKLPAPELGPVQLAPLLGEAIELYCNASIRCRLELAPDLPPVEGDARLLRQVFNNLFKNAVEAMPDGGELLVRGEVAPRGEGERAVVVEIADTGPGLPPEILDHVGEPYVSTKKGGSGLGVAVVTKIVHDHHGQFELRNRPQGGALARLVLPVGSDPRSQPDPARTSHQPASRSAARRTTPSILFWLVTACCASMLLVRHPAGADERVPTAATGADPIATTLAAVMPPGWTIAAQSAARAPSRWEGAQVALYFRLENAAVNIHHPDGYLYHPFIKLFFCPSDWSGVMDESDYYGEPPPSFLLGRSPRYTVFYQASEHPTWDDPWTPLIKTLALAPPRVGRELRLEVDAQLQTRLAQRLTAVNNGLRADALDRVVGLVRQGDFIYIEYLANVRSPGAGPGAPALPEHVRKAIDQETELLVGEIFRQFPELEAAYLRRLCDNRIFDQYIARPLGGSAAQMRGGGPRGLGGS